MNGGDKKLKISFFTMAHPKDHKLVCFSREEFEKKLVPIPKEQRGAIIANAYRVDCQDNSGRFAVDILSRVSAWPENCREFVFVGAGDRFFICPAEEENAEAVAVIETFLEEPEA